MVYYKICVNGVLAAQNTSKTEKLRNICYHFSTARH